jgi:hypothetical protein
VGKIRLAHAPMVNHWWQVPLYVTCRGLTTSPIPYEAAKTEASGKKPGGKPPQPPVEGPPKCAKTAHDLRIEIRNGSRT